MSRCGVLEAIGATPLVRLLRIFEDPSFELYAKLEMLNPGGSQKDRPALNILKNTLASGEIGHGTTIIESSSGNMGVGLAQACCCLDLRLICVVDSKTTAQNIRLIRAYGAEVEIVTTPDPQTGEFLQARINRVQQLRKQIPGSYWPNQYSNLSNPEAHLKTVHEIITDLARVPDYIFLATSTCGTLHGFYNYVRAHGLKTKIVAVDAVGSVLFHGRREKRLIPGHGAGMIPALFQEAHATGGCVKVTDLDCVVGCRLLTRREGILAGGSSGGIIMAIQYMRPRLHPNALCVAVLPDRGERYLETVYSDEWVNEHFGCSSPARDEIAEEIACAAVT